MPCTAKYWAVRGHTEYLPERNCLTGNILPSFPSTVEVTLPGYQLCAETSYSSQSQVDPGLSLLSLQEFKIPAPGWLSFKSYFWLLYSVAV